MKRRRDLSLPVDQEAGVHREQEVSLRPKQKASVAPQQEVAVAPEQLVAKNHDLMRHIALRCDESLWPTARLVCRQWRDELAPWLHATTAYETAGTVERMRCVRSYALEMAPHAVLALDYAAAFDRAIFQSPHSLPLHPDREVQLQRRAGAELNPGCAWEAWCAAAAAAADQPPAMPPSAGAPVSAQSPPASRTAPPWPAPPGFDTYAFTNVPADAESVYRHSWSARAMFAAAASNHTQLFCAAFCHYEQRRVAMRNFGDARPSPDSWTPTDSFPMSEKLFDAVTEANATAIAYVISAYADLCGFTQHDSRRLRWLNWPELPASPAPTEDEHAAFRCFIVSAAEREQLVREHVAAHELSVARRCIAYVCQLYGAAK